MKQLFQDLGVPPWERAWIPMLCRDDVVAAAGDRWVNPALAARRDARGYHVRWQRGAGNSTAQDSAASPGG